MRLTRDVLRTKQTKKPPSISSVLNHLDESIGLLENKYGFSGIDKFTMYKANPFSATENDIAYGKWIALRELRYRTQHPRLMYTRPIV